MKIDKFNNALLYSNKNLEKIARKLINESSNAVLMEMFDDKCVLADHTTGQIFEANYSFDGNKFVFENFKEVELEQSDEHLREAIGDYFDDANVNLAEAYETISENNSDIFEQSLTEALAGKNMSNVLNYMELAGIHEEVASFRKTDLFKVFSERIEKKPLNNIKMFNWSDPVAVSILDEDNEKILSKSMKNKAKKLRTNPEFKKELQEAAIEALDGDMSLLENIVNENISLVSLDSSELKETIGLSVVGNKTLMENRNGIVSMIEKIIEENEDLTNKKEAAANESTENDDEPEASEEDTEALKKALETAKLKTSDEKIINKIDDIIDSLNESMEAGETNVGAIKEAISLLML